LKQTPANTLKPLDILAIEPNAIFHLNGLAKASGWPDARRLEAGVGAT
jgi:hypothetical protein